MAVQVAGNLQLAEGSNHLLLVQLQNISENKKGNLIFSFSFPYSNIKAVTQMEAGHVSQN